MPPFFPVLQVSPHLFRSPQPDFEALIDLKSKGFRSLINLREEAVESEFFARQLGMNYLHLSIVDWQIPTADQVRTFLDFVEQPDNQPALVHCAAGVGRTGTMVACYRIAKGMEMEQALRLTNSETPLTGVTMNLMQQDFVRNLRM